MHRQWLQQRLGGNGFLIGFQFFKENPFVGCVLVDEKGLVSLLHQNVGAVQLPHHPPFHSGGHFQSGLLRLRLGRRRFGRFRFGGCRFGRLGGFGRFLVSLGQNHRLMQQTVGLLLNFDGGSRCGGGVGLGSSLNGGGEGLILLGGHGAEEAGLLDRGPGLWGKGLCFRDGGGLGLEFHLGAVYLTV